MSDLSERLLAAVHADWVARHDAVLRGERDPADWAFFERGAVVAVLRELDRIYHERMTDFAQLDVAALADEIEEKQ